MKYLREYTQQATTEVLKKNKAFFAFGNKQFNEQREPGVKYVSFNGGLLCPKENVHGLIQELDKIREEGIKKDVSENGFKAIVRREYFNYETQITTDNQSLVAELQDYIKLFPELFTVDSILSVCHECFEDAVEQDLF